MKRLKRTPRAKVALTRVQFHILCGSVISQEKEEMESKKGVGMEHESHLPAVIPAGLTQKN